MRSWHAIGLFCEDIREENRTLLGIFSDHLAFPSLPGILSKMGVYVRIHVDLKAPAQNISALLRAPEKEMSRLGRFDLDSIKKAQADSLSNKLPLTGFVITAIAAPMMFNHPDKFISWPDLEMKRRFAGISAFWCQSLPHQDRDYFFQPRSVPPFDPVRNISAPIGEPADTGRSSGRLSARRRRPHGRVGLEAARGVM